MIKQPLLIFTVFLYFTLAPSVTLSTPSEPSSQPTITYHEPTILTDNHEIRRREGGLAEGEDGTAVRGAVRGATRGATRGAVRGAVRGATRGVVRGVTRGAMRGAVRGATRGAVRGLPSEAQAEELLPVPSRLVVLAPQRTGLTASSQPTLYWFISATWNEPLEFTLIRHGVADPIAKFAIEPPQQAGIYSIDLASRHITLEANTEYEWFVNIILDPVERSGDFFGSGTIVYHPISPVPTSPAVLAAQGYWYDTIDTLSKTHPLKPAQQAIASLLTQQRLSLAAAWLHQQLQTSP